MSDLFFFNDTATTEIYTLSLHDALPIWSGDGRRRRLLDHGAGEGQDDGVVLLGRSGREGSGGRGRAGGPAVQDRDRKSTRLNSSHANISYGVFCLKKKKKMSTQCRTYTA